MRGNVAMYDAPCPDLHQEENLESSERSFCHLHDEFADVLRNSWPTGLRLPFPKQLETLAMPANQGLWFGDDQGPFPLAEARPDDERETGGVVQSSRLDLSLLVESQLLSQEQDLRAQGSAQAEREAEERSPSATRSVIKSSRKSSERFVF
jgi:hypothetical protein